MNATSKHKLTVNVIRSPNFAATHICSCMLLIFVDATPTFDRSCYRISKTAGRIRWRIFTPKIKQQIS